VINFDSPDDTCNFGGNTVILTVMPCDANIATRRRLATF